MKKQSFSNKAIMKRLDDLENRTTLTSAIFLLYAIGIAFMIGYFSTENIMAIVAGVICYGFGFILSIVSNRHKIRQWFTSRIHHPK